MKVGDLVRVKTGSGCFEDDEDTTCYWPKSKGQIGVVIAKAMRLLGDAPSVASRDVPAAKVLILALNEAAFFDEDELEEVSV